MDDFCKKCQEATNNKIERVCEKVKWLRYIVGGLATAGILLTAYFYGLQRSDHELLIRNNIILENLQKSIGGKYGRPSGKYR